MEESSIRKPDELIPLWYVGREWKQKYQPLLKWDCGVRGDEVEGKSNKIREVKKRRGWVGKEKEGQDRECLFKKIQVKTRGENNKNKLEKKNNRMRRRKTEEEFIWALFLKFYNWSELTEIISFLQWEIRSFLVLFCLEEGRGLFFSKGVEAMWVSFKVGVHKLFNHIYFIIKISFK